MANLTTTTSNQIVTGNAAKTTVWKEKRESQVKRAVPNITTALTSIITQSKNKEFQKKCLNILQVAETEVIPEVLNHKLWKVSGNKLGINLLQEGDQNVDTRRSKMALSAQQTDSFDDLALADCYCTQSELDDMSFYEGVESQGCSIDEALRRKYCSANGGTHIKDTCNENNVLPFDSHSQMSELDFLSEITWDFTDYSDNSTAGNDLPGFKQALDKTGVKATANKMREIPEYHKSSKDTRKKREFMPSSVEDSQPSLVCGSEQYTGEVDFPTQIRYDQVSEEYWLKDFASDSFWMGTEKEVCSPITNQKEEALQKQQRFPTMSPIRKNTDKSEITDSTSNIGPYKNTACYLLTEKEFDNDCFSTETCLLGKTFHYQSPEYKYCSINTTGHR